MSTENNTKTDRIFFAAPLLLIAAPLLLIAAPPDPPPSPTPEVREIERMRTPEGGVLVMFAADLNGQRVGAAFTCANGRLETTVFLGFFPSRTRALQLSAGAADGKVSRFGPVFRADARSGSHSPKLTGADALRFARTALQPGALVSNGFNSFFNRGSEGENRAALDALESCAVPVERRK